MALRDQPYIPLYVQDFLTDEKLNSCDASSQGVYIKIMCILHKQETYGCILLKQKDKQNSSMVKNFALKFAKLLPFDTETVENALNELVEEEVLCIDNDTIYQRRMVKDGNTSFERSKAAKKGGGNPNLFKQTSKQKDKQITEDEYEDENENETVNKDENKKENRVVIFPFDSEKFKSFWNIWKEYKSTEHKFKYKSEISEQSALKKISTLADGNEDNAIKILEEAMANGYKGFFQLDTKNNNNGKASKSDREQVYRDVLKDLSEGK
jgi:hypothetical protein